MLLQSILGKEEWFKGNIIDLLLFSLYWKKKVYFVLCDDWKLYIFREGFQLLNKVPFDSKYSLGIYMFDNQDHLLCLGVDSNFFTVEK